MIKKVLLVLCMAFALSVNAQETDDPIAKCNLGDAKSCFNLGFLRMSGMMGVKVDLDSAQEFLSKGCDLNHSPSCTTLGDLYIKKVKDDDGFKNKALNAYQKGCDLQDGKACGKASLLATESKEQLLKKGCDLKDGRSCNLLAKRYEKEDPNLAESLYEQSCNLKYPEGCRNFALSKKGNEQYILLNKYCDLGDLESCNLQGESLLSVNNDEQSLKEASELFKKACGIKSAKACDNLASMYEKGLGIEQNTQEALDNYMRGCVYGNQDSCKRAEVLASKLEALKK